MDAELAELRQALAIVLRIQEIGFGIAARRTSYGRVADAERVGYRAGDLIAAMSALMRSAS